MGQYFRAVVGDEGIKSADGLKVFCPSNMFENGEHIKTDLRLADHAWLNHPFCLGVEKTIYRTPRRVAWYGDYMKDIMMEPIEKKTKAGFVPHKCNVWVPGLDVEEIEADKDFSMDGKFLVNHTRKLYIDIKKYSAALAREGDVVDPLPILTATSNQEGMGDYFGEAGAEHVGTWAWEVVSVEDSVFDGYTEFEVKFVWV